MCNFELNNSMNFRFIFLICLLSLLTCLGLVSCVNSNSANSIDTVVVNKPEIKESGCKCKQSDIETLAYKYINEFDNVQNNLDSDVARTISLQGIQDNGNCTWQVEFRISWPFGNTDGAHPDEYITKTGFCNFNQVYLQ